MNNFDALAYLDSRQIKYKTSGKNIGNFYGISECVFCNATGYHLGISKTGQVSCWHCGKHSVTEFVKVIEKCGWFKAKEIVKAFALDADQQLQEIARQNQEVVPITNYSLPSEFTEVFPPIAKKYIENRNFDFLAVRKKHGILWSGSIGRAKNRIIFPIIENGKIVNWIGRSIISSDSVIPTMFERDINAPVKRKELLYGLDDVTTDIALLVEGAFDKIAIGNVIAMLSINFSKQQIVKLKRFSKFYICFDPEPKAQIRAKELESYLTWAEVNYIELPEGSDPGSLSVEDRKLIRRICE